MEGGDAEMLDSVDFIATAVSGALAGAVLLWSFQRLPIRRYAKFIDEPARDGRHEHHFDTMRHDGFWRCGEYGCGVFAPKDKQPKLKAGAKWPTE